MVNGIEIFRQYFGTFESAFVVISGSAATILLNDAGLDFRATKDVDVILFVEDLSPEFAEAFWDFIEEGGYENTQQTTGKPLFYRFRKPTNKAFPEMVELFSRRLEAIGLREGSHLTPIPIAEEIASLSAILMDDSYYALARIGGRLVDGIPVLGAEYLIPFKSKAWLDLSKRRMAGEQIDDRDIRKHKNDVFRLYQIISPESRINLPSVVADDLRAFLNVMQDDRPNLMQLGLRSFTLEDAIRNMREVYGLG